MSETGVQKENELRSKRLFSLDDLDILGDSRLVRILEKQFINKAEEIIRLLINFEESNYMVLKQGLYHTKESIYLEYANDSMTANKKQFEEDLAKLNGHHESFKKSIMTVASESKKNGLVVVVAEHDMVQDKFEYTVALNLLQGFTFLTLEKSEIQRLHKEGYFTLRELAINSAEPDESLGKILSQREFLLTTLDVVLAELKERTKNLA